MTLLLIERPYSKNSSVRESTWNLKNIRTLLRADESVLCYANLFIIIIIINKYHRCIIEQLHFFFGRHWAKDIEEVSTITISCNSLPYWKKNLKKRWVRNDEKNSWIEHISIFPGVIKIGKHVRQNYMQSTKSPFELLEIHMKLLKETNVLFFYN